MNRDGAHNGGGAECRINARAVAVEHGTDVYRVIRENDLYEDALDSLRRVARQHNVPTRVVLDALLTDPAAIRGLQENV